MIDVAVAQVEDDLGRGRGPRAEEQVEQVRIEDLQTHRLSGPLLEQHVGFAVAGLASGVGVLEAGQGRTRGQGLLGIDGDVGKKCPGQFLERQLRIL